MSGFAADWLALREPFDRAARAEAAAAFDWPAWAQALHRGIADDGAVAVLDLACGTGANLRELAPRLGGRQRWLMIDHDPALLAAAPAVLAGWAEAQGLRVRTDGARSQLCREGLQIDIEWRRMDLAIGLDALPWGEVRLVTASALLDLVGAPWLQAVVERCRAARAAVVWALSVDGRIEWSPQDAGDAPVHALFGVHQRRAKGFLGPALGVGAADEAARLLAAAGYRVMQARSDWQLDARSGQADLALLKEMVGGIAHAAAEQDPGQAPMAAAWRARRLAQLAAARLRVGHRDLMAMP